MRYEPKKGSPLGLVKTKGQQVGQFDLYDLRGMSLGKVECIKRALEAMTGSPLAEELLSHLRNLDQNQTIANG